MQYALIFFDVQLILAQMPCPCLWQTACTLTPQGQRSSHHFVYQLALLPGTTAPYN